jgi:hypothetical protein
VLAQQECLALPKSREPIVVISSEGGLAVADEVEAGHRS